MYLEAVLEITLQGSNILKIKRTEKQKVHGTHKPAGLSNLPKHKEASWEQCHLLLYIPSVV